jgi:hypothetical protein
VTQGKDKKLGIEANSERREVNTAVVSREMRSYARQRWPLANDKARKEAWRRLLGVTARRIKSLWEGEETAVPRATETTLVEQIIGHRIGAAAEEEEQDALRSSQENYRALEARLARVEALFESVDPEFGSEFVAAFRAQIRGPCGSADRGGTGDGPSGPEYDPSDFSD